MHGGAAAFNGGRTQFNTQSLQTGGDFTFINLIKMSQGWAYNTLPPDTTVPALPITELDADGYVTSIVAGTNGVNTVFNMPTNTEYNGNWVLKWDGNGTLSLGSFAATTVSGSLVSSAGSGRYVFTRDNDVGSPGIDVLLTNASPNHVRNIRLCKSGNEAALDAGQMFDPQSLALFKSAKPGAIRSLGWGGGASGTNQSLIALWSQRKPRTYVTYAGEYINPAWYGGKTTNSGTDYTLSYPSFTLTDKTIVEVVFNVSAVNGRFDGTYSTTSGNPINVNWPAHGLAAGNTVCFGNGASPPAPLVSAQTYFIKTIVDANNFTVSATSGGSVINATGTAGGSFSVVSIPRININSTGFVPITGQDIPTPNNIFIGVVPVSNPSGVPNGLNTIVYDQTLGWFWLQNDPLIIGAPPEVFVDYCAAVGAHPHMTAPFLTLSTPSFGGPTDFMRTWAKYATDTYPWMKPRIEPFNETWNNIGRGTSYAQCLSYVLWASAFDFNNTYGMWCSQLGQSISALYGNDRTKYSMMCAVQTTSFYASSNPGGSVDARLKSTLYVSNNGGDPAYKWVDRVCGAPYYSPAERYTCQELIDGYNYTVTYAANPTQQAVITSTYVATSVGTNTSFTLDYVNQCFVNLKAWGLGMPVGHTIAGITCYEGGYSPDYLQGASNNWFTGITAASQAASCVLTLASTTSNAEATGMSGNPAVVGMQIAISGVAGMTQLNGNTYTITAVSGNLVTINVNSTGFSAYTSGGQVNYVNSLTYSNNLRQAGGNSPGLGTVNTTMYTNFAALAQSGFVAEYPSNFLYTGTGNIWAVLNPDIYAPLTSQWNSIVAYNA